MCLPDASASADARLVLARAVLREAAEMLAGIDPAELTEGSLGESVADLMRVGRQLDGAAAVIAGRFAHSSEWAADGARDAIAWLRGQSSEGFGASRDLVAHAAGMNSFPDMGAAMRAGDVSKGHMRVLIEVTRQFPRLMGHLQEAEPLVVDLAREAEPTRFRRALVAMCHRLDPDGARLDSRDRDDEFYFRASTLMDGHVRVDGMLPAEVGSLLLAMLESARREVSAERADGEASGTDHAGTRDAAPSDSSATDDASGFGPERELDIFGNPVRDDPMDPRTRGQRNVEAFHRVLITAAGVEGGLTSVAGQRPQVNVTVSVETLSAEPGAGVDCGWLERFGVPVQPLSADTARRLACDASLRPLILDAKGDLVAFGTSARVAPPALRALVVRRDRHCRFAGCRSRIDEVHHIVFWSRGGATSSDNMLGLCWYHHHLVHEGGWELVGDANVEVKGTGPDGRVWTTGPPGSLGPPGG